MRRFGPIALAALSTLAVGLVGLAGAAPTAPATLTVAAAPLAGAVAEPGAVRFTAVGDYGATANTRAVLGTIAARRPDLNLALGDLSYGVTGAEQSWCDLVIEHVGAGFPFELLAGNHESNGINGNINDFAACLPNQLPGLVGTYGRQWYVDVPEQDPLVRFVMVSPAIAFPNGTDQYTPDGPRYAWTAAAIDGARAAGIPWVVVGAHKPCLSMGQYTCEMGQPLHDLLLSKRVDLVLHGHEHLYQRSKQLALSPTCPGLVPGSVDADCVADTDATLVKGAGTVLATVGTGGVALRDVNTGDSEAQYFAAWSGLTANPTWGALDVRVTPTTLTAGFVRASGGDFTDAFTITSGPQPANTPPSASATASCTGLECRFDGSGSTDVDGTVASHAWSFGDGATGTGVTPTHRYAAGGTYTATLTVTDDGGAQASATRTVTVVDPATAATLAADTFGRTTTGGFGTAEVGGAWRTSGTAASYAVAGGVGQVTVPSAGTSRDVSLPAVSSTSTDLTLSLSPDKVPNGSGVYAYVTGRRVPGVGEYRAKIQLRSNGTVGLALTRTAGSAETTLASAVTLPGLTYAGGDRLLVRTQASGTAPTTLSAKVWKAGTIEPAAWQLTRTDTTTGLQAPGAVGVNLYLSSAATNAPVRVAVDDVLARTP